MRLKANTLPVSVLVFLITLVVLAGCRQTDAMQAQVAGADRTEREMEPATTNATLAESNSSGERGVGAWAGDGRAVAKSGGAEDRARDGKARAGDVVAGDGNEDGESGEAGSGSLPGWVVLKVGGEPGTEFSGTCVVGGKEKDLSGQVPGRFVYELDGRSLECEVRGAKSSSNVLKISLSAGGQRQNTTVRGQGDEVSFALTKQGTAFSTYSSGSGGSVNQTSNVTSSSSSSVSSSSGSR